MISTAVKVPALPYEKAPGGSPDKYRTTRTVVFYWTKPPAKYWDMVKCPVETADGAIWRELSPEGDKRICLLVNAGFFFAISVAPSFPRAMAGGCAHDFIYKWVSTLAIAWGVQMKQVLELADHWFLALMRYTKFWLKSTYFTAVRAIGYPFNRVNAWLASFKKK